MPPKKVIEILERLIHDSHYLRDETFDSPKREKWESTASGVLERGFVAGSSILDRFGTARFISFNANDSEGELNQKANGTLSSIVAVLQSAVEQLGWEAEEEGPTTPTKRVNETKASLPVFISHSSKDRALAEALTDLLKSALGLLSTQIRCSSVDGHRLPVGVNTEGKLREEVNAARVVIGLVTPSSLASSFVMFELGARWGANLFLAPLLAGVKAGELSGPLGLLNALSADNDAQLHQLLGDIAEQLDLTLQKPESYVRHITQVKQLAAGTAHGPTVRPEGRLSLTSDLRLSAEAQELLLAVSEDPAGTVMCVSTMEGSMVSTNKKAFSKGGDPRSQARWKAAVHELVALRLLEPLGAKGEVFEITDAGYKAADHLRQQQGGESTAAVTRGLSISLVAGGTPPSQTIRVTANTPVKIVRLEYMLSDETCIVGEDVSLQGAAVDIPLNHDLLRRIWNVRRSDRNQYDDSGPAKIGATISSDGKVRQYVLPVHMEHVMLNSAMYAKVTGSKTFHAD
jgi:hypothetical protein